MANSSASAPKPTDTFDHIAHDLQDLRIAAGAPSYADIVVRIAKERRARGVDPARARPARSTVYDAFRPGRARINAALVGEIAAALGAESPESWVTRCQEARRAVDQPKAAGRARPAAASRRRPAAPAEESPASDDEVSTSGPDPAVAAHDRTGSGSRPSPDPGPAPDPDAARDSDAAPGPSSAPGAEPADDGGRTPEGTGAPGTPGSMSVSAPSAAVPETPQGPGPRTPSAGGEASLPAQRSTVTPKSDEDRTEIPADEELDELVTEPAFAEPTARQRWSFLGLAVLMNILGTLLIKLVNLPMHLDMVGTGAAAILLGPWWGALVAVVTTLLQTTINTTAQLPFGLVAVAGALVWGYGAQRYGMLRGIPRFMGLNLLVALVCTAIAVPLILTVAPWGVLHSDFVTGELLDRVSDEGVALTVRNLTVSIFDKTMSGLLIATILLSVSWAPPSRRPSLTESAHPTSPRTPRGN